MSWLKTLSVLSFFIASESQALGPEIKRENLELHNCGGIVQIDRTDWQTVLILKDVVSCPYVVLNGRRQSLQFNEEGRYTHFYVWRQSRAEDKLSVALHSAENDITDEFALSDEAG